VVRRLRVIMHWQWFHPLFIKPQTVFGSRLVLEEILLCSLPVLSNRTAASSRQCHHDPVVCSLHRSVNAVALFCSTTTILTTKSRTTTYFSVSSTVIYMLSTSLERLQVALLLVIIGAAIVGVVGIRITPKFWTWVSETNFLAAPRITIKLCLIEIRGP